MQGQMGPMKGFVRETFTSIQGEGLYVGKRMSFVRFYGCNLSCMYCDTKDAQKKDGPFLHEGSEHHNPVELDFLISRIQEQHVVITGGEPLLQTDFLRELCARLGSLGRSRHLETNGSLPEKLGAVAGLFDTLCLDFKIPSATGLPAMWDEHERCLQIARQGDVFVKIVVSNESKAAELLTACQIISRVDRDIPLVIQPVFGERIPDILALQEKAMDLLSDVRVIPQIHKYLNLQ
ncbi:MAG: 7-carboxy-7-deazaguanine synthase QueE [candidate division WOR-3 bacterium]